MTAAVLPFPAKPSVEAAVWFSGGSLHARYDGGHVRHLEPSAATERREFWRQRAAELGHLPTDPEARLAARRWSEITRALDALAEFERVMGRPRAAVTHTLTSGD